MALREEIVAIRDRTIQSLNDAHDYYTFTVVAWRTLQQEIQRDGRTLSWLNFTTKSFVNEKDILAQAQRYVASELTSTTFQQFVAIFENFLSDSIREWLVAHPERLSKRQLTGKDILHLPDKRAIVDALVERELRDIFYDRPANWFDYVRTMININSPNEAETKQFAEIKATRDVLVHGRGIANAFYIDKAGSAARVQSGQLLSLTDPYHEESWNLIRKLVEDMSSAMAAKA